MNLRNHPSNALKSDRKYQEKLLSIIFTCQSKSDNFYVDDSVAFVAARNDCIVPSRVFSFCNAMFLGSLAYVLIIIHNARMCVCANENSRISIDIKRCFRNLKELAQSRQFYGYLDILLADIFWILKIIALNFH